jgi:hypothetical protein
MAKIFDMSGAPIFSQGDKGRAHVFAHRMLDLGRHAQGHEQLGRWLSAQTGEGSAWVHLQWHMLVFELAVGAWHDAHDRFVREVLPAANKRGDAATDGPSGLWRLSLSAKDAVALPWQQVHASALARLGAASDPYVTLHDLLALAGAGDTESIDYWERHHVVEGDHGRILRAFGRALRSYAEGDFETSARTFAQALPGLPAIGGSRAQNELFVDIYKKAQSGLGQWDASETVGF